MAIQAMRQGDEMHTHLIAATLKDLGFKVVTCSNRRYRLVQSTNQRNGS